MNTYFKSFLNYDAYNEYVSENNLPLVFVGYVADEDECYYVKDHPATQAFTITAIDNLSLTFRDHVDYSLDGGETWEIREDGWVENLEIAAGDSIQLRGHFDGQRWGNDWLREATNDDSTPAKYKFSGNIMSLLTTDYYKATLDSIGSYGNFHDSFHSKHGLVSIADLVFPNDATDECYWDCFADCSNLTNAGCILPAKVIGSHTYRSMFGECRSLVIPPVIKATTIKDSDEAMPWMFLNCSSLEEMPELHITELKGYINRPFQSMFEGCTSLTTVHPIEITSKGMKIGDFAAYMFKNCTALTTAPEIYINGAPDTGAWWVHSFGSMFVGCTNLTDVSNIHITTDYGSNFISNSVVNLFDGCTSLNAIRLNGTTAPQNFADSWLEGTTGGTITIDSGADINEWYDALSLSRYPDWTIVNAQSES